MAPKRADKPLLEKFQAELNSPSSYLNLILGFLVVLVIGVLVFNYFKKDGGDLGPASQTSVSPTPVKDVAVNSLPGKYTVKDGDTLFLIAENYYQDGYLYPELVKANKLADENLIATGVILEIPKVEKSTGTGGAENQTIWGEKITTLTYTVVEGDWLSTIAGRVYGDPMQFDKIAKANNIQTPDIIEPGLKLTIPR